MSAINHRIRIFDYWQMQEPSLESEPALRKSSDSYIADDTIYDAQKLISNITQFLQSKTKYSKTTREMKNQINDLLATLYEICNSQIQDKKAAQQNVKVYKANLQRLYLSLRQAKILQNQITNYFQNANLANYDRQLTQLTFTQTSQVMYNRLNESLRAVRNAMHMLIETQKLAESGKELSNIFSKDSTSGFWQQKLESLLAHENIVKIHFLMLYQLFELDQIVTELRQFIKVSESEYLKYELVLDCLTLMRLETEQMSRQLYDLDKELELACYHPEDVDLKELTSNYQSRKEAWSQNTLIYQTNLQNFTRTNVETNMLYYSELKADFVQKLDEFNVGIKKHQTYNKSLIYLLDRLYLLKDVQRRTELMKKVSETDRRLTLSIYNQCSDYRLPTDCPPLFSLKQSLLSQIELFLVNNGIAYNRRAKQHISLEQDLIKYQKVIQQIENTLPHQQYTFIAQQIKHINASLFEVETLMNDKDRLLNKKQSKSTLQNKIKALSSYRLALIYASVIGKQANFQDKLQQFQEIKQRQGFEDLPLKFQNTVFNYINDIQIIQNSKQIKQNLDTVLRGVLEILMQSLTKSKLKTNIDSLLEKSLQDFKTIWIYIYHNYLRKISVYGQDLMLNRISEICNTITESIKQAFPQDSQIINIKTMQIDKKIFFTYRILNQLLNLAKNAQQSRRQSLKIINILYILDQIFKTIDQEFISKDHAGKICQLIKLNLLQQYFQKIYGKGNLWRAIRSLRLMGYFESIAQLYPSSHDQNQVILQALLQLQLQMNAVSLNLKQKDQYKAPLQEKVPIIIKQMRKFPLTLAVKHDVSGFISVFRYGQILQELKKSIKGEFSISKISKIFVCISQLKDARKGVDVSFETYQNVVVKEKKSISEYFEKARSIFKPRIQLITREIELASKNYLNRDESVNLPRAIETLCKKSQP